MAIGLLAEPRSIVGIAMIVMLQMTGGTGLAQSEDSGSVEFRNLTDATIRIDSLAGRLEPNLLPDTVMPNGSLTIAIPAGNRKFDHVAFRSNPQRVHRIVVNVSPGEEIVFRIVPHIKGPYILEDANSLGSIVAIPSDPRPVIQPREQGGRIADHCRASPDVIRGVVIWNESEPRSVRYYRMAGDFLCTVDGSDAVLAGGIYNYFVGGASWQDYGRHVDGDAIALLLIRTSSIVDGAFEAARLQAPNALFAQVQMLEWLRSNQPAPRLTTYHNYQTWSRRRTHELA